VSRSNKHQDWHTLSSQDLQRAFDTSRGFADLPFSQDSDAQSGPAVAYSGATNSSIGRLEFAALGVTSEVGELVGILKKWHRESALGHLAKPPFDDVASELGDIYCYVLKMASLLGRDIRQLHFERIANNILRFRPLPGAGGAGAVFSIAGPPGSGKTTAARLVALHLQHLAPSIYIEKFAENPHLPGVFKNPTQLGCDNSQAWFLARYREFLSDARIGESPVMLLDQDPSAIPLIYSAHFRDHGLLADAGYTLHLERLLELESELLRKSERRFLVLLDASTETLHRRSLKKIPDYKVEIGWITEIQQRFQKVYARASNVVRINTTDLSPEQTATMVANAVTNLLQPTPVE